MTPELYGYFGLFVIFRADDYEPIHVYGHFRGREARAQIVMEDGKVVDIIFKDVDGKAFLRGEKLADFKSIVKVKVDDIVRRWIDFFVLKKHNEGEVLNYQLVESAQYTCGYKLRLRFTTGMEREVDFERFLHDNLHPDLEKYRDPSNFKAFRIVRGNVMWGDYDMLFPISDLHKGTI